MPSATATWHNDTYPAISPSRAELSAEGKTIVIIGSVSHPRGEEESVARALVPETVMGRRRRREQSRENITLTALRLLMIGLRDWQTDRNIIHEGRSVPYRLAWAPEG